MNKRTSPRLVILAISVFILLGMTSSHEQQSYELVNNERRQAGLPEYIADTNLTAFAREHAKRMSDAGTIFHSSNRPIPTAENVGKGPSISSIHAGFMGSSTHRAAILNSQYTHMSVGVHVEDGAVYVVQLFYTAEPKPKPEPEPESKSEPEPKSSPESKPKSKPEPKPEPPQTPPPTPKAEPEPPPPPSAEIEPEAKPEREPYGVTNIPIGYDRLMVVLMRLS